MLKAPATFPYPGAEALLGDRRVKIIRIDPDGRRLVQSTGRPMLTRTVDLAELSDASLPEDPMGRWYAERVTPCTGDALPTPKRDLYDDFQAFARARGIDGEMPTPMAFAHFLSSKGHETTIRQVGRTAERCVPLTLLPLKVAA